jgi:hypothetical protein
MIDELSSEELQARIEACHEDVRAVYAYWLAKGGGRRMPTRADLDPAELKYHLPFLMLVDVTADERRFVYRLVGTAEVDSRGFDPTGRTVQEASFGGDPDAPVVEYDYVVRYRVPFCFREPYVGPDGAVQTEDIIYLPLSDDGETVNMIMVFTHSYTFRRRRPGSQM